MKFSIITVSFNAAATIAATLESVASQAFCDVEHIVIDGGSIDGTQDLVRAALRPGDRFVSEPDEGLYDAMNKGIALATGGVIGILNADDVFAGNDVLDRVAKTFDRCGTDAVLGDVGFFREGFPDKIVRRYDSGYFRPERIAWGIMPAHPGMYLTRAAYDQVGRYRTDFRIAADFEFVARAFVKHGLSFVHLAETIVKMRLGGVSTDGLNAKLTINREVLRACRENGIYSNSLMIASKYPRKLLELVR
jgi:glycosyltransferase involved in cell wall biosynthesis